MPAGGGGTGIPGLKFGGGGGGGGAAAFANEQLCGNGGGGGGGGGGAGAGTELLELIFELEFEADKTALIATPFETENIKSHVSRGYFIIF